LLQTSDKIIINNRNRYKWFVAIFAICLNMQAQQTYFQQEVNYKIKVELNDVDHNIKAFEEIQYINNASTSIDFIYIHLWPNAYKNNNTALAKQLLDQKKTDLQFASEKDRGYIDSLDFKVNGKSVKFEYDKEHIDICKVILNEPLRSLDTLTFTTPFFVKIPSAQFSRMGHDGQAYYITQWYPKPAVFDRDGWHPMPYLDQGEFFSEFGSFDVSITLPKNYVLAATGDRIDADAEEKDLNNNVIKTLEKIDRGIYSADMDFPPSSKEKKTVRFKQFRVHDFAWFADKRFNVLHDQITLPNTNRVVDTWVYFTNKKFKLWKDALDYVNESTMFYSFLVGDYPYNNVSAVDGVLMAGGGMEYPNITVIGSVDDRLQLDITIAHEVGHNWFYGILGSNERDHPALDEGVNSLYELTYIRAKYPYLKIGELIGFDSTNHFLGLHKAEYWREKEMGYFLSAKSNLHQPINTKSADLSSFNYGSIIYGKAAVVLDYLRDYMGEESFNKAIQFYYENYKFKHPKPQDLFQTLQYFSGSDLSWFSKYLINTNDKIDYKIKQVKKNKDGSYLVKVKNKTGVPVPINLFAYKGGKPVGMIWFDGNDTIKRKLSFPPADVDVFKIDGLDLMPDINRKNNISRTRGIFKKAKPLQINFLTKIPDATKTQLNVLPIGGYNLYNGFLLGAAFHNYSIYDKRFDFSLAPMYAFKSKTIVGFADVNYNFFPKSIFRKITIGGQAKSFSDNYYNMQNFNAQSSDLFMNYMKVAPSLTFEFQNKNRNSHAKHIVSYKHNFIQTEELRFSNSSVVASESYFYNEQFAKQIMTLNYFYTNTRVLNPIQMNAYIHYDNYMAKAGFSFKENFNISKKKNIEVRIFAGTFLQGSEVQKGPYRFRMSGLAGNQDYLFEANYLGRNEQNGLAFSQFTESDGAFKVWTPLGQSASYLLTANIKSPTIWKLPLKVFLDIGTADKATLNGESLMWATGLNFTIAKDIVEVYVPLFYHNEIKETLTLNNVSFLNTVRFTFNIHQVKPKEILTNNFL